jgi:hypothetical protein
VARGHRAWVSIRVGFPVTHYSEHDRNLWQLRLTSALQAACNGQTAIVIVPRNDWKQVTLSQLVHLLDKDHPLKHALRATPDALVFEGTRGQVRIYTSAHITYDRKQRRLLDYPHGTPTFLHPEVDA